MGAGSYQCGLLPGERRGGREFVYRSNPTTLDGSNRGTSVTATSPERSGRPAYYNHPSRRELVERETPMSEPIYKAVEIVGPSEQSISKAIENAIAKASGTLRRLGWFEVEQIRGNIAEGKIWPDNIQ